MIDTPLPNADTGIGQQPIAAASSTTGTGTATGTGTIGGPEEPVLVATDLVVAYEPGTRVLDGVSLTIGRGRWVVVIGPNGAGKSTLLKALVGLVPAHGRVELDPRSQSPAPHPHPHPHPHLTPPQRLRAHSGGGPARARLVAYVAQNPVLPPGMTVAEYVLLGRSAHLGWLAAEGRADREIVAQVLERLSLTAFADRPITDLSGGEVQRATLGRALAQQTPILVLDEPTSALDIGHQIAVLELIDELRAEADLTVVSAMHDLSVAGRFADELVLLDQGTVAASGPPAEVLTEATLSRYYQTPVQVLAGADGGAVVVPLRQRNETTTA